MGGIFNIGNILELHGIPDSEERVEVNKVTQNCNLFVIFKKPGGRRKKMAVTLAAKTHGVGSRTPQPAGSRGELLGH
jgi:hypothetical protein